jgi:hypothetical protein
MCRDDMLVHRQHIAQAAIERPFLIDRGPARGLEDELHHVDAERHDVAVQCREAGELHLRQRLAGDEGFPHVADDIEQMGAGRGQHGVGPRHCLLHEHIIAQPLRSLDILAQRVAPRRLAGVLDQRV